MSVSTAVAKQPSKAIQALHQSLEKVAGMGMAQMSFDDIEIPVLMIVQDLSPEKDEESSKFIPGCKPRDIIETSEGRIFETVTFIPVSMSKDIPEWKPRNAGGGLVKIHSGRDILTKARRVDKKLVLPESGNVLTPTTSLFGYIVTANGFETVVIRFKATQLPKAKRIMNIAKKEVMYSSAGEAFTAPLFARSYVLGSTREQNESGKWWGWTIVKSVGIDEYATLNDAFNLDAFIEQSQGLDRAVQENLFRIAPEELGQESTEQPSDDDIPL